MIEYSRQELQVFPRREKPLPSDWAERNIYLKKSSKPGRFLNANNPALAGIMNVFSLHHVRTGVLKKGIQTGGTQAVHILCGYEADYSNGNDNALIVMADEKSVKKLSKNRLLPIFTDSPALKQLVSCNPDDTTIYSINLSNNFRLDIGWATSEVSVSSEAYRVLVLDEIAKYEQVENIEDMKGRTNTFEETCKRWILSSPDVPDDPIDTEFNSCEVIMDFQPVCPHCGESQVMLWDNFTWPGKEDGTGKPNTIRNRKTARYACSHCGVLWDDHDRNKALLLALENGPFWGWHPREYVERFRSVAMHYPSWCSPFVSLSEIVAKWIEAQGKPKRLKKWHNTFAGEAWKEEASSSIDADSILKYRSELPRNLVPPDTAELWMVVDTQQESFYYEIWAAGYRQDNTAEVRSIPLHMVRHGQALTFEELRGLLNAEWTDHEGKTFRIVDGLQDSGGTRKAWQKHSRTAEVYDFCRANRIIQPIKGAHGRSGSMLSVTNLATYPNSNKPIQGGLQLLNVKVDIFKDELEGLLHLEPDDLGSLSFHCEIDETFAKHYTTESKNSDGDWIHHKAKGRNDYFDCNAYVLALRTKRGMKIPCKGAQQPARRIISRGVQRQWSA